MEKEKNLINTFQINVYLFNQLKMSQDFNHTHHLASTTKEPDFSDAFTIWKFKLDKKTVVYRRKRIGFIDQAYKYRIKRRYQDSSKQKWYVIQLVDFNQSVYEYQEKEEHLSLDDSV